MKKFQFSIPCLLICLACSTRQPEVAVPVQYAHPYVPPGFLDSAAFKKIKDAFPVIGKIYKDQMEQAHFPGIAFGVIANGQLVYSGAYGYSNQAQKTPATTQSLFRIASMTKSFTAMAILKLRDEGKLTLHDPVSKYIPEMASVPLLTTDAPAINIQHLLTMSAGFPEDNPWGDRQLADSDADLTNFINQGISFSNVPGVNFEYSNLGFAMLGRIVTRISGMPYQNYITENIMKPIGMNDAKWEYDEVPKERLALGYGWADETWAEVPLLHDGSYGAMGGLICSVEDFSKYVALHLGAWPPRSEKETGPVKRSTIREMHQPWRMDNLFVAARNRQGEPCPSVVGYGYGLGWRQDCTSTIRVSHGGGLPGFGSEWRIYPEYGLGVVSFSNLTYGSPGRANAIAIDTLIQLAGLKPRMLTPSSILNQRKEEIVRVLQVWEENQLNILAENFFLDLPLEKWKRDVSKIFAEAGPIVSVGEMTAENQLRGRFIIQCEKKSIEVFFTLTPEANPLVQQLDLEIK